MGPGNRKECAKRLGEVPGTYVLSDSDISLPEKNALSYMAVPPMTAASMIPFSFMLSGFRATGEFVRCS